jgi:hypothetical protein
LSGNGVDVEVPLSTGGVRSVPVCGGGMLEPVLLSDGVDVDVGFGEVPLSVGVPVGVDIGFVEFSAIVGLGLGVVEFVAMVGLVFGAVEFSAIVVDDDDVFVTGFDPFVIGVKVLGQVPL